MTARRASSWALVLATVCLFWIVGACESRPVKVVPQLRLVDPALKEGVEASPILRTTRSDPPTGTGSDARSIPFSTIRNDSRYVLATYPMYLVAYQAEAHVARRGHTPVELILGPAFPEERRLILVAQVIQKQRWATLPPVTVDLSSPRVGGRSTVTFEAPSGDFSGDVLLTVRAYPLPGSKTSYRTPTIEIPDAATLRFSLGVLEPAWAEGPVRFTISSCRRDDCVQEFEEVVDPSDTDDAPWLEREISLQAAGGSRSLLFETEHLTEKQSGYSFPVWGNPTIYGPRRVSADLPNIILVSLDTLRRDHLGLYGYDRPTSPFIDKVLAPNATVFDNLVSAATTTAPSHMTMFTSLPPSVHGAKQELELISVAVPTLAELLRNAGFETAAFTEDGPLAQARGFGIGFNEYVENKSPLFLFPDGQIELTFGQGREWLKRVKDQPFFLFLHTFQVHAPYRPPDAYRDLFEDSRTRRARRRPSEHRANARRLMLDYDREIRYVDDEIRSFVDWLAREGISANTILIVTSDHGEQFYEHGYRGHATLPYEEVAGVPLIFSGPGIAKGRRVRRPVAHIDLMPTILELLRIEPPKHLRGRSLAALVRGESEKPNERPEPIFTESWDPGIGFIPPAFAARVRNQKLIRYRDENGVRFEYYDLGSDPTERNNLYAESNSKASELRSVLDTHLREMTLLRDALQAGKDAEEEDGRTLLDPEREAQLRSLGYID